MFLGVAYHATFAYVPNIGRWYLVQDVATDASFDLLGRVLHAGRMQTFFVLSGFFAHLVAERSDARAFARDRLQRLLVPLAVAAPLVALFDLGSQRWAAEHGLSAADYRGQTDAAVRPLYLWFLEYSLLFSACCWPARQTLVKWRAPPESLLGLALVTWATQHLLGEATPAFSYLPQLASLAHFGPFFLLGWFMWPHRAELGAFRRCAWLLGAGVALAAAVYSQPWQWRPWGEALGALSTWAMVLGALGLAVGWPSTQAPPPALRWLVEASYWFYLSHYPLVVVAQLALARLGWPAWLKFTAVVLSASAASLGLYAFVVRRSAVGRWLTPSLSRARPAPK